MLRPLLAVCVALICVACAGLRASQGPPAVVESADNDTYSVYRAVLRELWPVRVAGAKVLVLLQETRADATCTPSGAILDAAWSAAVADHGRVNSEPRAVLPNRDLGVAYQVLPNRDVESLFKSDSPGDLDSGWEGFRQRFPDSHGYISVSAVGFDRAHTRALVYVTYRCGSLCGGGGYHFLAKVDGAWWEVWPADIRTCAFMA